MTTEESPLLDFDRLFAVSENSRGMGLWPAGDWDYVGLLRGDVVPSEPIVCLHHVGRVATDLMLGGSPYFIVISELFRAVLDDHGFTGWRTYPVDVRTKRDEPIAGFHGLAIVGRAGPPDWARSQLLLHPPYVAGAEAVPTNKGMYFEERSWDGSDLFLLGDTGFLIVTAAVRDALRRERIRNVAYRRLTEYEMPRFTLEM